MKKLTISQFFGVVMLLSACGSNNSPQATPELSDRPEEPEEQNNSAAKLWNTKHTPPALINPTTITLPNDIKPTLIEAYNAACEGYIYRVNLSKNEDALITFSGSEALKYPVIISGGKNVHVKGLEITLQAQNACLPNTYTYSNGHKNIHPRAPTATALSISPIHSYFIEGTIVDVNGHDADCIVSNNAGLASDNVLINQAKVLIQNSACYGVESSIDVHGDIFQTQGGALKELIFENFSGRQSGEGIILSYPVSHLIMRNYDYNTDPRFDSDDLEDATPSGPALWDDSKLTTKMTYSFENVFINYLDANKTGWFYVGGRHFISANDVGTMRYGVKTEYHPEVHFRETPPNGDWAPKAKIGRYYNPNE